MNPYLREALEELTKAGALKLPREETIENADDGKVFSGTKEDGELWVLKKNNEDSYSVKC